MNQIFGTLTDTILKILAIPYVNLVQGIWRFKLFRFKIQKVSMCDNNYTYQVDSGTGSRTGGNLANNYQNYSSGYYNYNYYWYPVYNWQNYYYHYNNFVHPVPMTNYNSFHYVPNFATYNQYYPTTNLYGISRDGTYNFRRVNRQNGPSSNDYQGKYLK